MLTIKFWGGLGNQMFQYALYKALRIRHPDVKVKADLFHYSEWSQARKFELESFGLKIDACSKKDIEKLLHYNTRSNFPLYKIWRFFVRAVNNFFGRYYFEKADGVFDEKVLDLRESYIEGYWQNQKYFSDIRNELLEDFAFDTTKLSSEYVRILDEIRSCNSVSVHVRRGDYMKFPDIYCGVCTLEYYKNAMEYIAGNVENPKYFMFTDDPVWARENFGENVTVVHDDSAETGIMDMFMMTQCRHNIIANSSFSWWGAWLNQNPGKIVVAPNKWFANSERTDQICDDWVKCGIN